MNNKAMGFANLNAVRILKSLHGNLPSSEEREILTRFTGWGAIAEVFDTSKTGWQKDIRDELQQLLTKEEYAEAQASTFNAHYTSLPVVKAMWDGLLQLGLRGKINALEPGCGIGRFIECTPSNLDVDWVGIERDIIPATIAQAIHPQAKILNQKFQDFQCEGLFDLTIGNIPFGDVNINGLKIHNFFIKKSIDLVRPGGFIVLITTSGTLDARGSSFRKLLSNSVNLVGAMRLPNTAFLEENTEITTDILVFKKEFSTNRVWTISKEFTSINKEKDFRETFTHLLPAAKKPENWVKETFAKLRPVKVSIKAIENLPLNGYYIFHPTMLLGELAECGLYGGKRVALKGDGRDLSHEIVRCFKEFETVYDYTKSQTISITDPDVVSIPYNHFFWKDQKLWQKGELKATEILKEVKKIDSMLNLWGDLDKLLKAQGQNDEKQLIKCRKKLNDAYDNWLKEYGYLNSSANIKLCSTDPRYYLLMALEVPAKVCGYSFKELLKCTQHFAKNDIFRQRTASPQIAPESADSIEDAILVSLNQFGAIDTKFLIKLRGTGAIDELEKSSSAFLDTNTSTWVSAEEYLSGNVREKLAIAQLADNLKNIAALEVVQPLYLLPKANVETRAEVAIRIGAPKCEPDVSISYEVLFGSTWVPDRYYGEFASELMQETVEIKYIPLIDIFEIKPDIAVKNSSANNQVWGTKKADFLTLLELGLTQKDPIIKSIIDKKTVVNVDATENARAKLEEIKQKFANWLYLDADRAEDITRRYNKQFNCLIDRKYRGEVLTLADANPDFIWRPHQKNAIWRTLQEKSALLGHPVGAGKTAVMCASAMESRRLGIAKKPMIVVLNSTISGIEAEFRRIYPFAKLKVSSEHSLSPENRKRFCTEVAMGDWDCVIITQSQFTTGIALSPESTLAFLEEELEIATQYLDEAIANKDHKSVKQIAKARERIISQITAAIQAACQQKDNVIYLEQTGVDLVLYDEAQALKNLPFHTRQTNVAGLPNTSFFRRKDGGTLTSRSYDGYMKVRWMLSTGKKVVFATGTPVSNTLVESWTMMRYLAAPMMKKAGIESFDSCLSTFFKLTTSAEQTPTGYKTRTRCSGIVNLPEFMSLWRSFVDVQSAKMLNLPAPDHETIPIECPASDDQAAYMDYLIERLNDIQKRLVKPDEDNSLKVYTDARAAFGIDIRLRWEKGKDFLYGKINTCALNVYRIWKSGTAVKATQAVFCDFSTPGKKDSKSFEAYTALRDVLVGLGIPRKEIAFIHEAKSDSARKKIIAKVNSGEIRVILGSTQKLGTGVNIQIRLVALHHIDCPWRPSDIEQRDGRIKRQGNLFDRVFIFRYVTQGVANKPGFDSYIWGVILRKLESFQVLMSGDAPGRTSDDVDPFVASAETMMAIASGDERIKRKIDVDRLVNSLLIQQRGHENSRYDIITKLQEVGEKITSLGYSITAMKADLVEIESAKPNLSIAGKPIVNNNKNAEEIGKTIADKLSQLEEIAANDRAVDDFDKSIGAFAGCQLLTELDRYKTANLILVKRYDYILRSNSGRQIALSLTIENVRNVIKVKIDSFVEALKQAHADHKSLEEGRSTPFIGAEELERRLIEQAELEQQLNPAEVPQQDPPTVSKKEPEPTEVSEPTETYEFWQSDSPCIYKGVDAKMIEQLKRLLEKSPDWMDRVISSCEAVLPKLASIDVEVFTDDPLRGLREPEGNEFEDDNDFFDEDDEEPVSDSLNEFDDDDDFFDD